MKEGAYRDLCSDLLGSLDATAGYAFVSAHQVAYELLFQCVRAGDDRHLASAAAIAKKYAKRCAYSKTMAQFADALVQIRKKELAESRALLAAVVETAGAQGWQTLLAYSAVEQAAVTKALGGEEAARQKVEEQITDRWVRMVSRTTAESPWRSGTTRSTCGWSIRRAGRASRASPRSRPRGSSSTRQRPVRPGACRSAA